MRVGDIKVLENPLLLSNIGGCGRPVTVGATDIYGPADWASMDDSLAVCAAAFMRNKGKDVFTESDVLMGMSMDLRWMSHSEAKAVLAAMIRAGVMERNAGLIRPTPGVADRDVPVAYRPPRELIDAAVAGGSAERPAHEDVMPLMMDAAVAAGMERREFMSRCNQLRKDLDIHIEAAALMVLRDAGADISGLYEKARLSIMSR